MQSSLSCGQCAVALNHGATVLHKLWSKEFQEKQAQVAIHRNPILVICKKKKRKKKFKA